MIKFPIILSITIDNKKQLDFLHKIVTHSDIQRLINKANYERYDMNLSKEDRQDASFKYDLAYKIGSLAFESKTQDEYGLEKTHIDKQKERNSRLATIEYKDLIIDGKEYVELIKFSNIESMKQLPEKYISEYPYFCGLHINCGGDKRCHTIILKTSKTSLTKFKIGDTILKTTFLNYLKIMKLAGERFTTIIRAKKQDTLKTCSSSTKSATTTQTFTI